MATTLEDSTKNHNLPSSLTSRDGWADYFEAQMTDEPHLHQIEPTNYCPYTCVMCPRTDKMTRPLGFMEMDLYRKIIDEVAGYSEPVRSKDIELFHFGESPLHRDFPEMVGYASSLGLNTLLSTKAFLLRPELTDSILQNKPRKLVVSMDGFDHESCRQICGANADFDQAVTNLEYLIKTAKECDSQTSILVRMIRIKANQDRTEAFKAHWEEKGVPVEIRTFFPWGEPELAEVGTYEQYPPYVPCPFPWQYLVVQWNGDVVACCRDYNAANKLGNVKDQSLKEIWNGVAAKRIRQQLRSGDYGDNDICRRCMDIYYNEGDKTPVAGSGQDLSNLWRTTVAAGGQAPYLIDDLDQSHFTYGDADRVVSGLMHRLRASGIQSGDRILLWAPIHIESLLFFWAAVQIGAVVVPLDPDMPASQAREIISRIAPVLALVDAQRREYLESSVDRVILLDADDVPPPGATPMCQWLSQEDLDAGPARPAADLADKPAAIIFTSGTTGRQKGVVLSHQSLANSGRLMAGTYKWSSDDVLMSVGDLHTMSGLRNPCVAAVQAGAAVVIAAADVRRSPLALAECVGRHRATLLVTVPAALRQFLLVENRLQSSVLASLRCVFSTADRLPEELRLAFSERFKVLVINYYGLTETAGFCGGEIPGLSCVGRASIGHPVGAQFRLVDKSGHELKTEEPGELWIKSDNLMRGYYQDPDATAAAFFGPWYKTGDLARRNQDGSFSLLGRMRDIIKNTHGEIVATVEVEEVLIAHPDIAEAGVGISTDAAGQESMIAFVVPSPQTLKVSDQTQWLTGLRKHLLKKLGSKRVPAAIRIIDKIPRNSNGKILVAQLLSEEV
jgi:radical SAM protein with 4Fe4S-binding SPASM domain